LDHRRIKASLPVFLVALLAFIWAPALANFAMAHAAADPLGATPICQQFDGGASPKQAPLVPGDHSHCCDLCHFVISGAGLPAQTPSVRLAPVRPTLTVAWARDDDRVAHDQRRIPAQARAPPAAAFA